MSETMTVDPKIAADEIPPEELNEEQPVNIADNYLRMDRMPHIWCPGCGIGTSVNAFIRALEASKLDRSKVCIVSGIGCTGRVSGYLKFDAFHTTHGRAIPFATGLKLANPELTVIVYSGDGDLTAIGGNHLVHAARRNLDLKVICVNNFTYAMTGGQAAPTTPYGATASTAPYGFYERSLNLPHFIEACGAVYVARWTTYHVRQTQKAFSEAFEKKGFSFVEVLSPCPTLFGRKNKLREGLDGMKMFRDISERAKGEIDTRDATIIPGEKIVIGKFVDKDEPSYLDSLISYYSNYFGDEYKPYTGAVI